MLHVLNAPKDIMKGSVKEKEEEISSPTSKPKLKVEFSIEEKPASNNQIVSPSLRRVSKLIHEGKFQTESKTKIPDLHEFLQEQCDSTRKRNFLLANQVSEQKDKLKARLSKARNRKTLNEMEIGQLIYNGNELFPLYSRLLCWYIQDPCLII